jgi:hypothetical protein
MRLPAQQHGSLTKDKVIARYLHRLDTPTARPAWVSNNPFQASPSAWLLSRTFFDTPHAAGLLWTLSSL